MMGINETNTSQCTNLNFPLPRGAQRLSASMESTQQMFVRPWYESQAVEGRKRCEYLTQHTDVSWHTHRPYRRTRGDKSIPVTRQNQSTGLG